MSCPAGTCIVTDGRLWRADGAVPSAAPRVSVQYKFLGPQFRAPLSPSPVQIIPADRCGLVVTGAEENNQITTRPELLPELDPVVKSVLGFRPWNSYGSEFGKGNEYSDAQRVAVESLLPDAVAGGPSLAEQLIQSSA